MGDKYVYLTCCVDSTAAKIDALVAAAVPVTYATFVRHCDPYTCPVFAAYARHPRAGLTLKADFMVHYFRSAYRGVPCYYADHSRIEYVWVRPADAEVLRRLGEVNRYACETAQGVPAGRHDQGRVVRLGRAAFAPGWRDPAAGESGRGDPGWAEPW